MSSIRSRVVRLMSDHDDADDAALDPSRNPWVQKEPDPHGEIVRQAPMVRRLRPETKPGKLRQLEIGDAYRHAATSVMRASQRRNQKSAWLKAARSIGMTVQVVTADDGSIWVYRRS